MSLVVMLSLTSRGVALGVDRVGERLAHRGDHHLFEAAAGGRALICGMSRRVVHRADERQRA
jgi:hypothetical protein